ncbi:nuclear transport factor 2 family protein [Cupriavidus necator H16]|uniref:Nuclear transport factor 2 family protein n=1 Tax=Cupriavidus necator (strain ATCC 17699 / DSM 428 / KCTC 22496 / NCIMB 10442 / H16 / Stanier 337) TaxID=381666 RepID=Q0K6V0_CUPNH|nr:nuclear transport factor 2 family protein [Cupriavidus necator H16]QQB75138.1 nuclear transport factor 2 family protein [Cupriavidus necator]CAJ94271.1 Hypothetical protein H16_A3196 [Cupriavidus necator H16]
MAESDVKAVMGEFFAAFARADMERFAACLDDEFVWTLPTGESDPHGLVVRGKAAATDYLKQRFFADKANAPVLSDVKLEYTGDLAIMRFRVQVPASDQQHGHRQPRRQAGGQGDRHQRAEQRHRQAQCQRQPGRPIVMPTISDSRPSTHSMAVISWSARRCTPCSSGVCGAAGAETELPAARRAGMVADSRPDRAWSALVMVPSQRKSRRRCTPSA